MPISRSAAVTRGFATKARCNACGKEIDCRSAACAGTESTSTAHVRRRAALKELIMPTRNANDDARPLVGRPSPKAALRGAGADMDLEAGL